MKQGEEKTESASENAKKQENISNQQMMNIIADLTKKIEDLQKTNQAVATPVPQGITMDQVTELLKTAMVKEKQIDYQAGIQEAEIPLNDYDEKGVRFCAPFTGYVITCDKRKGHRVVPPYGKQSIFFEYQAARRVQQGKYEAIAPYSAYTSHSKKEIQWLKDHSLYNIMFYESSTMAANADVTKMQKLAKIMTVLQTYDFLELIKVCKSYDVPTGEDAAVMRANLAYKMVDRELESERAVSEKIISDTYKESKLLGLK